MFNIKLGRFMVFRIFKVMIMYIVGKGIYCFLNFICDGILENVEIEEK